MLSLPFAFLVCIVINYNFSSAEKQRETCKEVANQPSWVEEFHDACFKDKNKADKMEKPKGWHHSCSIRKIPGIGSIISSGMTKMTKIDTEFGDASANDAPNEFKIVTMLRSAGKKGLTAIQCHKKGTQIVEVVSTYNTTLPDEPFANMVKISFPTPTLADCYELKQIEDPEAQRNQILTKIC